MLELQGHSSGLPDVPVSVGARLGPYRLGPEIANGGMASVHLGSLEGAHGFGRVVAIKRIHPHLAREREFVDMFLDEARIAARISHPFVASVTDFGEWQGQPFITMELLLGEPLSRVLAAASRLPSEIAAPHYRLLVTRLIADLCEGLHAAHEVKDDTGVPMGVVHRDISPTNLLVLYSGTPKILDFGIARAENRLHQTLPGSFKGKLAYAAPEVLMAQPYDRRSDIWSMGVVLWEMLTASRLFWGETDVERIIAVTKGRIPPPSERQPTIPPELEEVTMMALAREPERRYQTARAMSRDLERFLGHWGDSVPHADVADWIGALFPGAAERKQELLRTAFAGSSERTPPPVMVGPPPGNPPARPPLQSVTAPSITDFTPEATTAAADVDSKTDPHPPPLPDLETQPPGAVAAEATPRRGLHRRPLAAVLIAVLGIGALVLVVRGGSRPQAGSPAVAETAPASTAVPNSRPAPPPPPPPPAAPPAPAPVVPEPAPPPARAVGPPAQEEPPRDEAPPRRVRKPWPTRGSRMASGAGGPGFDEPPPAPSTPSKGQLLVRTPGGPAEVFYRGRLLTRTPALLTLTAGQHELQIRAAGDPQFFPLTVTVKANETVVYDVSPGRAGP
jgi:eukaryotic-like serine/threonine-protein kinase